VFLFVMASVALLAGLVGLVAGSMPWTAARQQNQLRPRTGMAVVASS
jgi:hypothetical protein